MTPAAIAAVSSASASRPDTSPKLWRLNRPEPTKPLVAVPSPKLLLSSATGWPPTEIFKP